MDIQLIRTIGIKSLIVLGHVLTIIRVFAYTLLPKGASAAWIALALHLLNGKLRSLAKILEFMFVSLLQSKLSYFLPGIAFSALWGAGVVQADELAPPSLQATSQGTLHTRKAG
jgi:hypothetical protein